MTMTPSPRPTLHVREKGCVGPAFVFLHYYGGSSRTWSPVIDALPADTHTIAVDLRGWGESDKPDDGYTLAAHADDIEALIEAKGLKHFILVGHSMGGKIAQLLASRKPEGLRALILTAPATPTPLSLPAEVLDGFVNVYDTRESIEGALENMLLSRPLPQALHEQVVADSLKGARAAKAAWPLVMSQEDISGELAGIDVPVLVIAGGADKVDPVEAHQRELLPRLSDVAFHVLPGFGHLLPLEAPVDIVAVMSMFLDERVVTGPTHPTNP
jgi:pimeloyl-ACP methyl ester carboxylesterase